MVATIPGVVTAALGQAAFRQKGSIEDQRDSVTPTAVCSSAIRNWNRNRDSHLDLNWNSTQTTPLEERPGRSPIATTVPESLQALSGN